MGDHVMRPAHNPLIEWLVPLWILCLIVVMNYHLTAQPRPHRPSLNSNVAKSA